MKKTRYTIKESMQQHNHAEIQLTQVEKPRVSDKKNPIKVLQYVYQLNDKEKIEVKNSPSGQNSMIDKEGDRMQGL